MACNCANCQSLGLGAFGPVPPLAQHGFRLSLPGGPKGGQFHGRVSANPTDLEYHGRLARHLSGYPQEPLVDPFERAPGEVPPRPNAAGDLNIHTIGRMHGPAVPGYAMVPGGLFAVSRLGALPVVTQTPTICPAWGCGPVPVRHFPVDTRIPWSPTNIAPMPWPGSITAPAPTVSDNCPAGQYRDAAGNCTDDWHNPYPISLPAQPSPVVPASTASTPTAGQPGCVSGNYDVYGNCVASTVPGTTSTSWLTDPTQELISGIPNWGLLAAAAGALLLMRGRR